MENFNVLSFFFFCEHQDFGFLVFITELDLNSQDDRSGLRTCI